MCDLLDHLLRCRGERRPHRKARAAMFHSAKSVPLARHAPCGAPGTRRSGAALERNRAAAPRIQYGVRPLPQEDTGSSCSSL